VKLELKQITKTFGPVVANDSIDLSIEPGEIHGLLGENGAGKSTLMNVIYGMQRADSGEICIDGALQRFRGPNDAIAAGIGMVHQHFMLIPVFTVAENVMLGNESTTGPLGRLDRKTARTRVRELSEQYGLDVDPDALVEDLPVGVQQRVEILKALVRSAGVLILDEPTAVLTPQEIDDLMRVMRELRAAGTSIVFITHKLREVKAVCDRITVIRQGRVVEEVPPSTSELDLAGLMVGGSVHLNVEKNPIEQGRPVLEVSGLRIKDDRGQVSVDGIDFEVGKGEILALAGVQGNGQEELAEALIGTRLVESGQINLDGRSLLGRTPHEILASGIGFIPEDRQHDGLISAFTVAENLVLDMYDRPEFSHGPSLRRAAIARNAEQRVAEFDIRPPQPGSAVGTLSGGNQQKVVVARELSRSLKLLVISQPTRGVDVGAQMAIYERIVAERDRGTPVVLVSTELDEVLALADRIAVMYRGKIIGVLPGGASRDQVGLMMAGVSEQEARSEAAEHPTEGAGEGDEADGIGVL
jgi:simple sugar transport system ATP-binding protein